MSRKQVYLGLCIVGTLVPYAAFVPWLIEHGLDISRIMESLFANRVSAFFGLDVIVSALVLWVFIAFDAARIGMKHRWVPVVASLVVGVSLALPLFLYMRESAMDLQTQSKSF